MRLKSKLRLTRKRFIIFRTALAVLLIVAFFSAVEKRIRPVITTMSEYQCRVVCVLAMNEAVSEVLLENNSLYTKLVNVQYAQDNSVVAVEVNSLEVNKIKEQLTRAVTNKLLAVEKQIIGIPIGSLTGWQLLSGKGPKVNLEIIPTSYVSSEIVDKLDAAGINQTQHRIFIKFSAQMSAIMAGYSTAINVESEMCIAQMLIVGKVPQLYSVSEASHKN